MGEEKTTTESLNAQINGHIKDIESKLGRKLSADMSVVLHHSLHGVFLLAARTKKLENAVAALESFKAAPREIGENGRCLSLPYGSSELFVYFGSEKAMKEISRHNIDFCLTMPEGARTFTATDDEVRQGVQVYSLPHLLPGRYAYTLRAASDDIVFLEGILEIAE